ncbi:MAG: hypothetical protein AB1898_17710 [Acidobacteriota bacterium]
MPRPEDTTRTDDPISIDVGVLRGFTPTSCDCETLFKITLNGDLEVLYNFDGGVMGSTPYTNGGLYGTTNTGGLYGKGLVYRLSAPGGSTWLQSRPTLQTLV